MGFAFRKSQIFILILILYGYIGWDIGVASMARGELAIYTIKSDYAYGSTGSPPKIPGGATLIFEIEVSNVIDTIDTTIRERSP